MRGGCLCASVKGMKQPSLFNTLPKVGEILTQLYRTTGYRMRPVRVLSVDEDNETFVCGPLRGSDTARFTLDSSLVKPLTEKPTRK